MYSALCGFRRQTQELSKEEYVKQQEGQNREEDTRLSVLKAEVTSLFYSFAHR